MYPPIHIASGSSSFKTLQYKIGNLQYATKLKYEIYNIKSNIIGYCKNVTVIQIIVIQPHICNLQAIYKCYLIDRH